MRARPIAIDGRALAATTAAVLLCALLAAFPPAWRMARAELGVALRETSRALAGGHHRLRSGLVVVQVAVALMLLVGAGLLMRSFVQLLDVNPGFQTHNLLTISTQVPMADAGPSSGPRITCS